MVSLNTEECTPLNSNVAIENDLASNEASILKFSLLHSNKRSHDATTVNTNNLVDHSANELNLSIDMEGTSVAIVGHGSLNSQTRLNGDEQSLGTVKKGHFVHSKSLFTDYSNSEHASIENTKSLNTLNQVYYSNNSTHKECLSLSHANSKCLVQNKANSHIGNIVKLDMPD